MLSKKDKKDSRRKKLEDIGVTKIIQELVELKRKVLVLTKMSLKLIVQRSMQHH